MVDFIMRGWHDRSATPELAWAMRIELYEADRDFRRARARAIIRATTGWMKPAAGAATPSATPRTVATSVGHSVAIPGTDGLAHSLPIEAIVGVLDEQGRRIAGIPILRRSMLEAWRRMYREPDHSAHLPLEIVGGADGWFLSDGTNALLELEILRARGVRRIPVRTRVQTPVLEEEDDCCGAA